MAALDEAPGDVAWESHPIAEPRDVQDLAMGQLWARVLAREQEQELSSLPAI